ncbi:MULTISPECIES: hypothetical protein [Nocardia]|uniref:hypothetical protein n=1 Tax=Nocardia TaxID=1817 RepID=UPI0013009412|nr:MULTISPECIES: hypothetical protein [Nocardia]
MLVPVARKPDVFVRAVISQKGRKLAQIARCSKAPVRMRRAVVVAVVGAASTGRVDR